MRKLQKLREGFFLTQEVDICAILADVQREFGKVPDKKVTLNLNGREHCLVGPTNCYTMFFQPGEQRCQAHGGQGEHCHRPERGGGRWRRHCRVAVEDDGPGIPDDFKGKIFNRMLKGSEKAKGMGLGLYLVKSLVESYGGRVWVEDRVPGDHTKGARFWSCCRWPRNDIFTV